MPKLVVVAFWKSAFTKCEVEEAKSATEDLIKEETGKKRSCAARIKSLDEAVASSTKAADERLAALDAQITEKEAALGALRATIASLAKL